MTEPDEDAGTASQRAFQRCEHFLQSDLREKPEAAKIDCQNGNRMGIQDSGDRKERAVASEYDDQIRFGDQIDSLQSFGVSGQGRSVFVEERLNLPHRTPVDELPHDG